jgi:hypothetical protein
MAKKIYVKSNYFYIVDTETDKIFEGLAKDVRVRKEFVDSTFFFFDNVNGFSNLASVSFSDIQDENGDAYADIDAFVSFYEANTGNFNQGGSSSLPTEVEDALLGAISPSETNVFVTKNDLDNASSTFKTLPADVTTTLATAQAITALNHSLDANSTYIVRGNLRLGCSGAGGVKLALTYPTSTIAVIQAVGQGANINTSTWVNHSNASSGVLQNAVSTSNTVAGTYIMNGTIKTGGTTGNLVFSFASTTAGQTSNVYTDGSFIEIIKIS